MKFLVLALSFLFSQTPGTQANPESALVEGFVQKLGTTDPVARARVVLTKEGGPPTSLTATTDGSGKFTIRNVEPGRYRLSATRDGYVRAEYGQRGPALSGTPITLGARQELKDVRIQMTPTGAIAGRVYDRYGDPVGNATVQALKYTYQDGRRVLSVVQGARTNDLGEYRLFWMQPGQYIVSAVPNNRLDGDMTFEFGAGSPLQISGAAAAIGATAIRVGGGAASVFGMPPSADTNETYLTVYYPGTTDGAAASPIDLRPGASFTGVDLTVVDSRAVRIRGRVISSRQSDGGSVALIPRGTMTAGGATQRTASVSDQGTFEFRGVAPGSYDLVATSGRQFITFSTRQSPGADGQTITRNAFILTTPPGGPGELARPQPNSNEPRLFGRVSVDVGDADVENVTIQLQPGVSVQGRIAIDGPGSGTNDSTTNMRVFLRPDPMIPQLLPQPASVNANGTFTITDVPPGDYRLSVTGMPRGGYVKSAALGGSDASNLVLHIEGEPRGGLDVLVGTNPGSLDATVQNDRQEAVPGVTVVLVPSGTQQLRSELYRLATSDASGRIHLDSVVPGDYKLFAWENVETGAWQDPEFLRIYEARGKPVRITEGGRQLADVVVIPYR